MKTIQASRLKGEIMKKKMTCPRCTGDIILPLGKKIFECEECGYLFKEFDDREDVMLKISEYLPNGDLSDTVLCECMCEGIPNTGRLKTFGAGKLHISVDAVESDSVTLTFHYRDRARNRTVKVNKGEPYGFCEGEYNYSAEICE